MGGVTDVYVEAGGKRTFASAASWPGWSRSGKDEASALAALAEYAPRYARVARLAGVALPPNATDFEVIERLNGSASTDFGVPGMPAKQETHAVTDADAKRMTALVEACWKYLDQVRRTAPAELRKGPRGGGRDREAMFAHVLGAEVEYAKRIGLKLEAPDPDDAAAVKEFRAAIAGALLHPNRDSRWPVPYAARRTAWHALDHAWEMEDRIP